MSLEKDLYEVYGGEFYTKDDYKLSNKQFYVIYQYMDCDLDMAKDFVKNNTYTKVSQTIKKALSNRLPNYNPENENAGDR